MFATRQPNFKRRLAGHLGGLVGATAMLLTVFPTIAGAVPPLKKLTLEAVCTVVDGESPAQAVMVVGNENDNDVLYDWKIASFVGSGNAKFGDNYKLFPAATGKLALKVGDTNQASTEEDPTVCVAHVDPTKVWRDAHGDLIEKDPPVPQDWALTLRSSLETLTCTWNSGLDEVKCHSVDDPEDKLHFVDLDDSLEVPIGGTYTIDETPTPGFVPSGLGTFGPIAIPTDLAAFFGGGDTIAVQVTNGEVAVLEGATTTVEETTTTTAAPPTTLAPVEETTTTTAAPPTTLAPVEETTTTVEETTTTVEETTTTTESPATTLAPVEETTTTVEETTTTEGEQESTTTTEGELKIAEESTTTTAAPTTTSASSTTMGQTSTTAASADTGSGTTASEPTTSSAPSTTLALPDPDDAFRGATEPLSEGPGETDSPSEVDPNSDELDTLPTTGTTPLPAVVLGLGLVAIGLCIAVAGRRRLDA